MAALNATDYDLAYWQTRYENRTGGFEWYTSVGGGEDACAGALVAALPPGTARSVRVLDLGCGTSSAPFLLASLGYEVVGCDYSPAAVSLCTARAVGLDAPPSFSLENAVQLSFTNASFHAVLDKATLDSLDCRGDTPAVLAELSRVLRPGGLLCTVSCRPIEERSEKLAAAGFALVGEVTEVWAEKGAPCSTYWFALFASGGGQAKA